MIITKGINVGEFYKKQIEKLFEDNLEIDTYSTGVYNYKNEIEIYKITKNKLFKGYSVYEMTECKKIDYAKALPNAIENICKVLEGKEKMKSPAENSLKVFELLNKIICFFEL